MVPRNFDNILIKYLMQINKTTSLKAHRKYINFFLFLPIRFVYIFENYICVLYIFYTVNNIVESR